jgi:hypothetical protein
MKIGMPLPEEGMHAEQVERKRMVILGKEVLKLGPKTWRVIG